MEQRVEHPLLDLKMFADRSLAAASGLNLLVGFSLMVGLVSVPLFINLAGAQDSGSGALVSGYLLSAFTVPMALAAIPGGWLADRFGYRLAAALGVLIALGGFGLMTQWQPEFASQAVEFFDGLAEAGGPSSDSVAATRRMATGLFFAGVGLGLTIAPIGTTVINGVGESDRGMASALVIILRLIGMSLSVSTLTAYGLRRSTVLSRRLLEGVALTEIERIAEAALQVAARITVEMALIAAAVCAVSLIPALMLATGRLRPLDRLS
ncbi:MAG: hypothetical protein IIA51_02105 [Chloroflexi bacterium]|nr:hypothetical protein [Chloroflexota bacterium]